MLEDDDDEVLQEIPVFSTRNLADKLYLYQYPNELREFNFEQTPIISSSVKLANREVKLEVELNTQSNNYDYDRGERIGMDANGPQSNDPKKPSEKFFRRDIMDRVVLESRHALPDVSNYMAGILHENALHITPLKAILHLRKSFSYLDQIDKHAKKAAKDKGLDEASGDEEEEEVKQVTVKFARQENDRYKLAKERSFNFLSKKSAEEPWHHTEFHDYGSELSKSELRRLISNRTDAVLPSDCSRSNLDDQIAKLSLGNEDVARGDDPLSVADLRKLPAVDRVKNLLREVCLTRFSRLISLLNLESDVVNALRVVQQMAVLVQGNWIARSELLYKKDDGKAVALISPDLMCRGRDYILYLFTKHQYLNRKKVSDVVKISPENVKEILSQIACLRVGLGWELLLPEDKEFIASYPDVVDRQQLQWDIRQKQLKEAFKDGSISPKKTRRKSNRDSSVSDNDVGAEGVPKRKHRRKSQSLVLSSDNESGPEGKRNAGAGAAGAKRRIKKENISS